MFEKQARTGLIVKLYYNRDAKKLKDIGDVIYHSKKMRYVQVYVDSPQVLEIMQQLKKERFVKKVQICHIQELDRDFVGSLHRQQDEKQVENAII